MFLDVNTKEARRPDGKLPRYEGRDFEILICEKKQSESLSVLYKLVAWSIRYPVIFSRQSSWRDCYAAWRFPRPKSIFNENSPEYFVRLCLTLLCLAKVANIAERAIPFYAEKIHYLFRRSLDCTVGNSLRVSTGARSGVCVSGYVVFLFFQKFYSDWTSSEISYSKGKFLANLCDVENSTWRDFSAVEKSYEKNNFSSWITIPIVWKILYEAFERTLCNGETFFNLF